MATVITQPADIGPSFLGCPRPHLLWAIVCHQDAPRGFPAPTSVFVPGNPVTLLVVPTPQADILFQSLWAHLSMMLSLSAADEEGTSAAVGLWRLNPDEVMCIFVVQGSKTKMNPGLIVSDVLIDLNARPNAFVTMDAFSMPDLLTHELWGPLLQGMHA